MKNSISFREFARRAGCDDKVVRRKVQSGHLLLMEDGKLDPRYLDVDWRKGDPLPADNGGESATTADSMGGAEVDLTSADAKWTKAEAERVKENYAALLKQLEYDLKSGAVVEIDDVVIAIASEYAVVRNKMLDVGTRVAPKAAVMKSAEEIKALIDAAVIEALEELSIDDGEETDFAALRESLQKRFGPTVEADAEVEE